jgi:hypothetical protein
MLLVGHLRACLLSFFPLFLRSECLVSYTGRENDSFFCYHSIASSRKNLAISTSSLVATFVFPTIACKLSSLIHCQNCFSLELSGVVGAEKGLKVKVEVEVEDKEEEGEGEGYKVLGSSSRSVVAPPAGLV